MTQNEHGPFKSALVPYPSYSQLHSIQLSRSAATHRQRAGVNRGGELGPRGWTEVAAKQIQHPRVNIKTHLVAGAGSRATLEG